ncbi:MAG: hypothetical protein IJC88_04715 [Oscillospiraceae bacterium]|nr:hypothetical protein [Oscillospiraceae bacterium]
MKKGLAVLFAISVLLITLVGCTDYAPDITADTNTDTPLQGTIFDRNISMVQNGSPELIPNITYKDAYDNFFSNPQWRGFKADDGSDVVEFSGDCTYCDQPASVYIQFVIDGETSFTMHYAGITVGEESFDADEESFLELVYTPFETYSQEVLGSDLDQDVQEAFSEIYASIQ